MIVNAGWFLLKCVSKHDVATFDELRFIIYHMKNIWLLTLNVFRRLQTPSDNTSCVPTFNAISGYDLPLLRTLISIHLTMGTVSMRMTTWYPSLQQNLQFQAISLIRARALSVPKQQFASAVSLVLPVVSTVNVKQVQTVKIL